MDLKQLLFGGGANAPAAEPFRDSIQAWLPVKNIVGGVVVTKDGRFVKILEVLPVNIYLKSPNDRENIISSYAAWLKIAPDDLQIQARTLPADTADYVERMKEYAAAEPNPACREMIEDNIKEIGQGVASDALRHIVQRLNEEADTARRYLDGCELEVLEPSFTDDFILKLLYEIINKRTARRVQLPEGVFDMTTAVHGVFEE